MKLRLILPDQLNEKHSWFSDSQESVMYVMMELMDDFTAITIHKQKILAILKSMRLFYTLLSEKGYSIEYISMDDEVNQQKLSWNLLRIITENNISAFEYQEPDSYDTSLELSKFAEELEIPVKVYSTEHFYTSKHEAGQYFADKKQIMMENFYRYMRKKHHVMVYDDKSPFGGKWNFDAENRNKFPEEEPLPEIKTFTNDVTAEYEMLGNTNISTAGNVDPANFIWPLNRNQAEEQLEHFIEKLLPLFGKYQDAMTIRSWSLFHSRLSFALNRKIINPDEIVNRAVEAYNCYDSDIDIAQVEGFVRQVLGWREFVRGVYWHYMPDYKRKNHFFSERKLPDFYWTADTEMNCLRHSVQHVLDYSYAHHIERLMVLGNFSLLAGVHPDEIDNWFLGMFSDALEWVEMPNVRGMSQFADGGIVGTKPYVASANYIDKMSDYCKSCRYKKNKKTGKDSCPFNSLYWNFYHKNEKRLYWIPRIKRIYTTWHKMEKGKQNAYLNTAKEFLSNLS